MKQETLMLVKLKYELPSYDNSFEQNEQLYKTYPKEVASKWAWRCAADVEHFANGHKEAMQCIRVAKAYRDGTATLDELKAAYAATTATYAATTAATYAATTAATYAALAATITHAAATYAAHADAAKFESKRREKFNHYLTWLLEELCAWEEKQ